MAPITDSNVFLDMDPGIDDALAMVTALARLNVRGVTTVAGNVSLAQTFHNAHFVLEQAGRRLPVFAGAEGPLFYPLLTAHHIHGTSGLGDAIASSGHHAIPSERAWTWLAAAVSHQRGPCHLIATGPLTNIALLLLAFPEVSQQLASITCMAGGMPGTRLDKDVDFNVFVDPHAADAVFRYGIHLRLVGINVTHRARVRLADLDRLDSYGRLGKVLHAMLSFYGEKSRGEGGDLNAFPVDDAVAVAAVDAPDLFRWESLPLTVVLEGPLRGTVVVSPLSTKRPPVKVAADLNVPGFLDWLWESLSRIT